MAVNLLLRTALTVFVLLALSSTTVYGLYGGSAIALVGAITAGVLVVGLLIFRRRVSRFTQRTRVWRWYSKGTISPRALKWIVVVILYVVFAASPALTAQSQMPRLEIFALSFGVWGLIFGFFYIIWWIIAALQSWRRSLRPTIGSNK